LPGHAFVERVCLSAGGDLAQEPAVLTAVELQVGAVQLDGESVLFQRAPLGVEPSRLR